jgi:hypothetical protein
MTSDHIIDPEIISSSSTYQWMVRLIREIPTIHTILEIGASSGAGTTEALVQGILQSGREIKLASIEVSKARFSLLSQRYQAYSWFTPYNVSSLPVDVFPSSQELIDFLPSSRALRGTTPDTFLSWRAADINYVLDHNIPQNGIEQIKSDWKVSSFDMCVIDGSEFLGNKEFEALPGADIYVLDDIFAYKNHYSHQALLSDFNYGLVHLDESRGGSSIFVKKDIIADLLI